MTAQQPTATATPATMVIASVTGDALLARLDNLSVQQGEIKAHVAGISPALTELQRQCDDMRRDVMFLKQRNAFLSGIGTAVALLLGSGVVASLIAALHH